MKKKLKALKKPVRVTGKPTPLRAATKPVHDSSEAQRMALAHRLHIVLRCIGL